MMTEAQVKQQHEVYPALVGYLKKLGLLGVAGQPVREIWFSAHAIDGGPRRALEVHLVPLPGAEPAKVEEALGICRKWDWGPPKPPKVTLADPYREPEERPSE